MSEAGLTPQGLADQIGFSVPESYNMSRLLWDNLPQRAEAPAVLHDEGTWSYGDLAAEAARLGNHLLSLGCEPGDRVVLCLGDEPAFPAAVMGATRAGLVPTLINPLSPDDLLRFSLEDGSAKVAIASAEVAPKFSEAVVQGTSCHTVLNSSERLWGGASDELPEHPTHRTDMAFWMYTSGSTGKPKGVVHKHEDPAYTAASWGSRILGIRESDITFSVPKAFHAYGFGNSITFPFSVGGAVALMSGRPTPANVFGQIARHKPTLFFGVPTLYTALLGDATVETADLTSVRLSVSAAEVLSKEVLDSWRARFGHSIIDGLGSTEMLHIYLSNDAERQKAGSAGRVVPGYTVRLKTPDGKELAPEGEEGVMEVMGTSRADYYWNRPDKTAETMRGDWLWTGDRFICDEDGYYYFLGRQDDLVKVSGEWVYPLEIELTLNEHPEVQESCVQAVTLPDGRTTIHAWVVATGAPDAALEKRLKDYAKSQLLPFKYPRQVKFMDALPKAGVGKIDRQSLLKQHPIE